MGPYYFQVAIYIFDRRKSGTILLLFRPANFIGCNLHFFFHFSLIFCPIENHSTLSLAISYRPIILLLIRLIILVRVDYRMYFTTLIFQLRFIKIIS